MNPLSIRISEQNQNFLKAMSASGKSKSKIVNDALDLLRRVRLKAELTDMAISSEKEDALLAEEGMVDYLTILEDAA